MHQSDLQLCYASLFQKNRNLILVIIKQKMPRYYLWHDDLLQDIALKGWKAYQRDPNILDFPAWISTIARRAAVDMFRYLRSEANRLVKCNWWYEYEPYSEHKMPVLDSLSQVEKQTLQYRIDGLSFKEISILMGEPEPRLRVRITRLKEKLAASLKHELA